MHSSGIFSLTGNFFFPPATPNPQTPMTSFHTSGQGALIFDKEGEGIWMGAFLQSVARRAIQRWHTKPVTFVTMIAKCSLANGTGRAMWEWGRTDQIVAADRFVTQTQAYYRTAFGTLHINTMPHDLAFLTLKFFLSPTKLPLQNFQCNSATAKWSFFWLGESMIIHLEPWTFMSRTRWSRQKHHT